MFIRSVSGDGCTGSMRVTLNSKIMGAVPNDDQPEGIDRRDIIFYCVMAALLAFAVIASKYL